MNAFDTQDQITAYTDARRLQIRTAAARLYYDLPVGPAPMPTPRELFIENFERLKASVAAQGTQVQ
jgi:hypothetical protein